GGRQGTGIDALDWVGRAADLGAGEILLNSMDADGTKDGYDLELIRLVRGVVEVPVVASGGAGAVEHFAPAVEAGADAVLAASGFHFGEFPGADAKAGLRAAGVVVRCPNRSRSSRLRVTRLRCSQLAPNVYPAAVLRMGTAQTKVDLGW